MHGSLFWNRKSGGLWLREVILPAPAFRTVIVLPVRCIFIPGRSDQRRPENVQYPKRAQQQWTEWFGLLTGAMYIPIELFEIMKDATWPKVTVLVINAGIVGYLGCILLRARQQDRR
jgi:hypothetical protein